jgi:hypothetical protein
MFTECSLNVPLMSPERSLNVPQMQPYADQSATITLRHVASREHREGSQMRKATHLGQPKRNNVAQTQNTKHKRDKRRLKE